MPLYEHVFLTRQDASNTQVDQLTDQFKTVITSGGGKVGKSEYWGLKSLTFRIKKNRKAHYSYLDIDAPPAAIARAPHPANIRAIRAYEKAGFEKAGMVDTPDGPALLMVRNA